MRKIYGHEFTLFCDVASPESRQIAERIGVELVTLDTSSTNSALYWLTLAPRVMLKRRRLRTRIVTYDVAITSMFPMNWLVENLPIPKIHICYEPFAFFYDARFTSSLKVHERWFFAIAARLYARFDRRSARSMNRTVTVSQTNVSKIQRSYGIDAEVIYAGVETSKFFKDRSAAITRLRESYDAEPLLFHSTDLSGTKGTVPLLSIFQRILDTFPRARLLVTVYVENAPRLQSLRERIAKLKLEASVHILGCLPREELPHYYNAVDAVCQPSLGQPASWPLRESLMCGTPIVGGIESEEVQDGVNGCRIDVTDVDGSVKRLETFFRTCGSLDPTDSGNLIRKAFSRERSARAFEDILLETRASSTR
jgi:glycosyltransferase involved in cell wall biosynthesis